MPQALYRKWRSQTFDEVVGQEHVTQTLKNALREDRVAHAYLFSGPRGTGKTSTARILAKALNCSAPENERPCNQCPTCIAISEGRMIDLIEIDAASNRGIDDIRELRERVGFRPSEGRLKVYIIDEVHMLTKEAFNALLKTLEEPPPHARFILATTEPERLLATVLSRCQRFDFRRIPTPEIAAHLRHIMDEEGYAAEDAALTAIAQSAEGCMRDAISLLDQMISYGTESVSLEQVQQVIGAVSAHQVSHFVGAVAAKEVAQALKAIQQLSYEGLNLVEFTSQVVEYLRSVMLLQMTGEVELLSEWPEDTVQAMQKQAQELDRAETLYAIKRFAEAIPQLKGGYQPQLPLELAVIDVSRGEPKPVVQEVVAAAATPAGHAAPGAQAAQSSRSAPSPASSPSASDGSAGQQAQPSAAKKSDAPANADSEGQASTPEEAVEHAPLDEKAVQRLRQQWDQILLTIRDRCGIQVQAAVRAVRDIAVSDNSVAFAFGNNDFTRRMIEQPETLKEVGSALSEVLGRPVFLQCQMGEKAQLRDVIRTGGDADADEGPDPLVDYLVTEMGAKVVEPASRNESKSMSEST